LKSSSGFIKMTNSKNEHSIYYPTTTNGH